MSKCSPRNVCRPLVGILGALLLASFAEAQEPCIELSGVVVPGDRLDLNLSEAGWVEVQMRFDRVYRMAVSAPGETNLELWRLDFDEARQCFTKDRLLDAMQLVEPSTVFEWTDQSVVQDALLVAPPGAGEPASVEIGLDEIAAPPSDGVLVVPAVAHLVGAGGEVFQSDLTVFNPLGVSVEATLTLVPTGGSEHQHVPVTIPPNQARLFEDLVSSLFGLGNTSGALRISFPAGRTLTAVSRTSAVTTNGSFGQFIPAQTFCEAASLGAGGATRVLPYLEKSADFRSNVGFVEVLGLEARLELSMHDESGAELARRELTIPPLSHYQVNDVFAFLEVTGRSHAAIRATLKSHGRVFVYASVIDNHTSDPVYVPGLTVDPPHPFPGDDSDQLLIPAAASSPGAFSTIWQTDVRIISSTGSGPLEITFVPDSGAPPSIGAFPIAESGGLSVDDVVSQLGGSGSGHLWLRVEQGGILAASRTYTSGPVGTYGQFIPAVSRHVDFEQGVVLGLRSDEIFRSNIGLVNPSGEPVEVSLRLVSATGEVLGVRSLTLARDQGRQLNDLQRAFGTSTTCRSCRVEYQINNATGPVDVYVWGSVIDNETGDAIFVPPHPL